MFKNFMKKYGYYIVAFVLMVTIGLVAGLNGSGKSDAVVDDNNNSDVTVNTTPIEMLCPMNSAEVIKWYSDTDLFYNETLKHWESHRGVDLTSATNTEVYAVLDGTVSNCKYSYEDGYTLTLSHADGLTTTYSSLAEVKNLNVGDSVSRGQIIANASNTASNENLDGTHLHFEIALNGMHVDPANYITFENK